MVSQHIYAQELKLHIEISIQDGVSCNVRCQMIGCIISRTVLFY